jgi:hypothetical protein
MKAHATGSDASESPRRYRTRAWRSLGCIPSQVCFEPLARTRSLAPLRIAASAACHQLPVQMPAGAGIAISELKEYILCTYCA